MMALHPLARLAAAALIVGLTFVILRAWRGLDAMPLPAQAVRVAVVLLGVTAAVVWAVWAVLP